AWNVELTQLRHLAFGAEPVQEVFPAVGVEVDASHYSPARAASSSMVLTTTAWPDLSRATASMRRRALAGDRSREIVSRPESKGPADLRTASPPFEFLFTGKWSSLTCWMRGTRRERASLALMATAGLSLLDGTGQSYHRSTDLLYQGPLRSVRDFARTEWPFGAVRLT